MYDIRKVTSGDIELVLDMRYTTLKNVFGLDSDYSFDEDFQKITREYFEKENQTTVLAFDGETPIGCATICYLFLMPTCDNPTGKRAHIMNVYVDENYRRKGIAYKMMIMLIEEAKEKGVTEITLDTSEAGRLLYEKLGFRASEEGLVLRV